MRYLRTISGNYDLLCDYFSAIDWLSIVHNNPSAIQSWNAFVGILNDAVGMFVPKVAERFHRRKVKPHYPHIHRKCAAIAASKDVKTRCPFTFSFCDDSIEQLSPGLAR